jgi:hypothetical protein
VYLYNDNGRNPLFADQLLPESVVRGEALRPLNTLQIVVMDAFAELAKMSEEFNF